MSKRVVVRKAHSAVAVVESYQLLVSVGQPVINQSGQGQSRQVVVALVTAS